MYRFSAASTAFGALLAVVISLMTSTQALAHAGHDHSGDTSALMHMLFYGSLILPIALCLWLGYRYVKQHNARR
jgi:hypothetical protein